ncbi:MAG: PilZ domain-containing protein [bacterium]|nr:PilZ domain-containing protein [bacterium]
MSDGSEKRKSQRIEANLKVAVSLPQADGSSKVTNLESLNISTSGIYFKSDHFIEPMTKLGMSLELPIAGDDSTELPEAKCEGIVVRVLPEFEAEGVSDYEVAVFFTHIDGKGLDYLEDHIASIMAAS